MRRARIAQLTAIAALLGIVYAYPHVGSVTAPQGVPGDMMLTASHMPMLTATAADSFTAKADRIPSSHWTATASSQSARHPASNAIDGNSATFWESRLAPKAAPLPHSITINMHASKYVAGLTYLPRQDQSLQR